MNTMSNFDYAIFTIMLIVTLLIGLHHALKRHYQIFIKYAFKISLKTNSHENVSKIDDYLVANGKVS
jgi:hypothetical protein